MRPIDILPQRDPFLLVDELVSVDPGKSAVGRWHLRGDEWFFSGHFPGRPTLPGVLMIESLAQLGGIAVLLDERYSRTLPLLGGVERARFRRQVLPGETLEIEITVDRLSTKAGKGHGTIRVEDQLACEAQLLFVIVSS